MWQKLLDHSHRSAQVDLNLARHIRQIAGLIEFQVAHDPGVIDEGIERRKLREHALVQDCCVAGVADIALQNQTASRPVYASLSSSVRYLGASAFTFSMNAA
jgi:hypothetical protein